MATTETLADMVRRTSRRINQTEYSNEFSLLVIDLSTSDIEAVLHGIKKWTKIYLSEENNVNEDLISSFQNSQMKDFEKKISRRLIEANQNAQMCIFDELLLINIEVFAEQFPDWTDRIQIRQDNDPLVILCSINAFLEETTVFSKLKLLVLNVSDKISKCVFDLLLQWTPQCKVLLVTYDFPRSMLKGEIKKASLTFDKEKEEELILTICKADQVVEVD